MRRVVMGAALAAALFALASCHSGGPGGSLSCALSTIFGNEQDRKADCE
jgi:hypothetical protein